MCARPVRCGTLNSAGHRLKRQNSCLPEKGVPGTGRGAVSRGAVPVTYGCLQATHMRLETRQGFTVLRALRVGGARLGGFPPSAHGA